MSQLKYPETAEIAIAEEIRLFTITNSKGTKLVISNYGAAIVSLFVKDKNENFGDVVLGYDRPEDYRNDEYYIGTLVGRYANRIAGDTIVIDNEAYKISARDGGYHLHGGSVGFNKKIFQAAPFIDAAGEGVILRYTSPHLEEGFPGELCLEVKYTLDEEDAWTVEYRAICDRSTFINLTQHAYFNLSGNPQRSVDDHELQILSNYYLPVNKLQVPTGELADVANTPFNFTYSKKISQDLMQENEQLKLSNGYDHSFVLKRQQTPALTQAAIVKHMPSGRKMEVLTTEPAVHFYSGNFLENVRGKKGIVYNKHSGFCLETQNFPDAPNHPHFPSAVLKANEQFYSKTVFKFSVE